MNRTVTIGERIEVKIDRTGQSGDQIAYPLESPQSEDRTDDGIHVPRGTSGDVFLVEIVSTSNGYPLAKVVEKKNNSSGSGDVRDDRVVSSDDPRTYFQQRKRDFMSNVNGMYRPN